MSSDPKRKRVRVRCTGAVQGVGFRPFVHRLATEIGLDGWVLNDPDGVLLEVEGPAHSVTQFLELLPGSLPQLARLDTFEHSDVSSQPEEEGFRVLESRGGHRRRALVPPDAALCAECRFEMGDPYDRRHHYAFTGCAGCGPRFSLVRHLPYDRHQTTMECFPMCEECRREYESPQDRRFHTEPICCPSCGPDLWFLDSTDVQAGIHGEAGLEAAVEALKRSEIVALKGLGGFQLACRADSAEAISRLRTRKNRPTKPFAVMAPGLSELEELVSIGPEERELLLSPRSPIILAPAHSGACVNEDVAPGIHDLGVMLPTTPLHVELFRRGAPWPLVMTSGNLSDEPIAIGNREALSTLQGVADAFLMHDRDIARRVDDSVIRTSALGSILVRRARGWVPEPIKLIEPAPQQVLALGAHLQVTACLLSGSQAIPSKHVGDLETEPARLFLREVAGGLEDFLDVEAEVLAADLHPDYGSTLLARQLGEERGARLEYIQHHLAHVAAVLGEHGLLPGPDPRAVGIILDGTGWGPDGTAWGGEWLLVEKDLSWHRADHLGLFPLVGGELAVREPWRVAVAILERAGDGTLLKRLPLAELIDPSSLAAVRRLSSSTNQWPMASGAGRIFEAMGALLGLVKRNGWEGEAAARLESLATTADEAPPWPELDTEDPKDFPARVLGAAARRVLDGESRSSVARGFHETIASLAARVALRLRETPDIPVVLGGGCFVNRLLLTSTVHRIRAAGARVLWPQQLPPGDGGISFGQAAWTAALLRAEKRML